ncbi:MAG: hypothetical protein KGJ23_15155 [Euryarchaeota archaeon]|nr:hypothetical protein [Euryarchaeota archaeon]MDE1837938.1 hypothetical protein [Euryarchaeota archaeon]MDE1880182.1 hypothetical protein [Euryarchaeota archaeon]MDE2045399.1 hypothetical protein [Thermoplasmata archaeon]
MLLPDGSRKARRDTAELGGLRFELDTLAKDVVIPLYPADSAARAREERTVREPKGTAGRGTS